MADFILLTAKHSDPERTQPVLFNVDLIRQIWPKDGGSYILQVGDDDKYGTEVIESQMEIDDMLSKEHEDV